MRCRVVGIRDDGFVESFVGTGVTDTTQVRKTEGRQARDRETDPVSGDGPTILIPRSSVSPSTQKRTTWGRDPTGG